MEADNKKQYHEYLRNANQIESENLVKCEFFLKKCIELVQSSKNESKFYLNDLSILQNRLIYLEKEIEIRNVIISAKELEQLNNAATLTSEIAIQEEIISIIEPQKTEVDRWGEIILTKLLEKEDPTYEEYLTFYSLLSDLFNQISRPIVYSEGEIAYFIGDTHGSYEEAIIMIRYFLEIIEKKPNVKIVFIGDYVDRNPFDFENITLIFAFWVQYQNNVILLRGNHEDVKINEVYGFQQNLIDNFVIPERVNELFGKIGTIYKNLAIVNIHKLVNEDKSNIINIFTSHGGIPIDFENPDIPVLISQLEQKMIYQVASYDLFDNYMNWLLWSDPKEEVEKVVYHPETGRNQFGLIPFNNFMSANNLHFMVRAHEVIKNGYQMFFNDRLVSLFSTSYYKNRKIGDGVFLRLQVNKAPMYLPINSEYLKEDILTF